MGLVIVPLRLLFVIFRLKYRYGCPLKTTWFHSNQPLVSEFKATLLKVNEQDVKLEEKAQLGRHEGSIKWYRMSQYACSTLTNTLL